MIDKKPEVLAPAGDRERLEAALRFGADAVYLGGKLFNMRAGTRSFTQEELAEAVKLTHQMGKRLYLTCNTLLNNEEADLLPRYLAEVHEMGVDAAIVSDIGVLMAAHRAVPELELHISTQAGVTNWLTAAELHRLGAKRVVLARELPLTEIEELGRRIPRELAVEGLFAAVGQLPQSAPFAALVNTDGGYYQAGEDTLTGCAGVFAAGDGRVKSVRQLTTAVGDGAVAGLAACRYVDAM